MGNHDLTIAREALANFAPGQVIGLENRLNLNFMATGFGTVVVDNAKRFINSSMVARFVPSANLSAASKKLERIPYATLDKYVIRTPEGVNGPMVPYLEVLDRAADDLLDIRDRLLNPLKQWLGRALTHPGFVEKVWMDADIRFIDVENHVNTLAKHYDDKVGDDISFNYLHKVYPKPSDFHTAQGMINDLVKESAILLGHDIPKLTEEISVLVKKLIAANEKADYLEKMPSASAAKLSDMLYHAGREVELLSIVLFQIKVASVAYEESVDKIIAEL